jgi:lipopolysaccharide export system protein LptA
MPKFSIAAAACMLAGLLSAAAPQSSKTPPVIHQRSNAAVASKAHESDSIIEANIRARFAKSKINADKFTVHVQGGIATIEGRTDVMQHKGVATRMAKTGGALAVNNHVQISEAAKQKAAENLEKGRRRAQVKRGDSRSQTDKR